ncbi:MAG: DeoR/GlpR family DNA-binding transcription regulator [Gammaproteobacteria bacterium]
MDRDEARPISRRQSEILALARDHGRVSTEDLAARFVVTPQTIRRDLNELCETRTLTRVHGGAIFASGVENLAYEARKLVADAAKRQIGQAAAQQIPDNSSLFINIGTTTEEVARALRSHSGLLVITNNLHVAQELHHWPGVNVIVAGGTIRRSDGAIVGSFPAALIREFRADHAVIGTSAIDPDGSLLDFDLREVEVSRAIIENARRVILVTDSSKFARSAPVRIGHLADIDVLVTDRLPSPEVAELCARNRVTVIETGAPAGEDDDD